ncbi:MAG TPA: hypothetical protein VN229_16250 [Terriglobales bacterium]|nr:hypothetical protein [Terriglobales bacterium]
MSEAFQITEAERKNNIDSLQAEINRMAEMVFSVSRDTGLEAVNAALALAAEGQKDTPDKVRAVAFDVLARAEIMQSEIDRFMTIARNTPLGETH